MIQILKYGEVSKEQLLCRSASAGGVEQAVSGIIAEVRKHGDGALRAYSEKFDRVKLDALEVSQAELAAAPITKSSCEAAICSPAQTAL